jgi:hypothetical protein
MKWAKANASLYLYSLIRIRYWYNTQLPKMSQRKTLSKVPLTPKLPVSIYRQNSLNIHFKQIICIFSSKKKNVELNLMFISQANNIRQQRNTGLWLKQKSLSSIHYAYEKVSTHPGYPYHYAYEKASTHPFRVTAFRDTLGNLWKMRCTKGIEERNTGISLLPNIVCLWNKH